MNKRKERDSGACGGTEKESKLKKWGYPYDSNGGGGVYASKGSLYIIYSWQGKITKLKKKESMAYIHI